MVQLDAAHRRSERLMGNAFHFTIVTADAAQARHALDAAVAEIRRIERLLTTYSDDSETARINASAGLEPVPVSSEVFALIDRCQRISALTQGAFDITYGSIDKRLWNFDRQMDALPDAASVRASIRLIDYRKIRLDAAARTVFLEQKGARIGFGGIGKGYAAERAKAVLRHLGIESGVVNASGDLTCWGEAPGGGPWTVALADPDARSLPFATVPIRNAAVATSGNYEKFVMIAGKRYSHTIDPRSGYPVAGIKSVTILCPNAELADALATPVMVMGIEAGIDLVNQLREVECVVIDDAGAVHCSDGIKTS